MQSNPFLKISHISFLCRNIGYIYRTTEMIEINLKFYAIRKIFLSVKTTPGRYFTVKNVTKGKVSYFGFTLQDKSYYLYYN